MSDPNANPMARVLLVTIWELGEAFGPVLIAPLSEMFGRYPVFNISNTLFLFATIASATATHLSSFALARCLNGLAVASNVLNPAVVGDMFPAEQRGAAMSLVMLAPLVGGAVGPAIGGALAQGIGWRGFLGVAAGLAALCELGFAVGFRETYITAILARRARTMKREVESTFGDARSVEAAGLLRDAEATKISASMKLWSAIMRPIEVLFGSGVLMAMSLYGSVVFAYFYVLGVTFPDILERNYGFEPAQTGTSFMAFSKYFHLLKTLP